MGDYFKHPVRETDIHFIVNEINAFANCVQNKEKLIGALQLSPRIGADLEHKYRLDGCNLYSFFTGIISKWINLKRNEANTVELDKALRSLGWKQAADNVKEKWFSARRSAAALETNASSVSKYGQLSEPIWFNMRDPISSFTGREDTLEQVYNLFSSANTSPQDTKYGNIKSTQVAIVGLAEIGKSEFARKFAQKYYTEFDRKVAWINAETVHLLQESFKGLADEIDIDTTNVSSKKDYFEMIQSVYKHCSQSNSLFIFDNVESWFDGEDAIKDYCLPKGLKSVSRTPYILMTSRNRPKESENAAVVDLSVLTEAEAVQLIQHRLGTEISEFPLKLATLLGNLPLALQQAISYIRQEIEEDISGMAMQQLLEKCIQSFIENFDTEAKKFLNYKDGDFDYDFEELKTTWVTWRVTLDNIRGINPYAVHLLEMMSYIAPDNIDLEMFPNGDLKAAVNTLVRFSMITKNSEKSNIVSVHRLVQRVVRMDHEEKQAGAFEDDADKSLEPMLNLLNNILDQLPHNITHYTTSCIIHAQVAWEYALAYPKLLKQFEDYPANLYNKSKLHGMYTSNLSLLQRTFSKYKLYSIYGESEEQYIRIQHFIACALLDLHKYENAKSLYQIIHKTAAEKLGESHPLTLNILNGLALAEDGLGNHSEEIIIIDKIIAIRTATPNTGPYHKETLTSLHNKAAGFFHMEKYDEALELFKSTLELWEKHHPEDRKSINDTRYMIAATTQQLGNFAEALQMFRNLHAEWVESFGESHTDTLRCARRIGDCLLGLGKCEEAMELLKYNLNLAIDNPGARLQCANMRFSIAKALLKMHRYDEAISHFRIVWNEQLNIYEETHPEVLTTREGLADALQCAGRTGEALQLYKFVYDNRVKILRAEHPDTIRAYNYIEAILNKHSNVGQEDTPEKVCDVITNKVGDDKNNKFTIIGKIGYSHGDQIGTGSTGSVYQGYFETRDVRAAVKIMFSGQVRIYKNEINIMRKLNHPNIIRYFASESYGNLYYFAMELADQNLDDFVKATPQKPLNQICGLLQDACDGLSLLHTVGIIHRDIKPTNILIFLKGGKKSGSKFLTSKIGDFGTSKVISDLATQSTAKGTLLFMSHECMKAYDERKKFSPTKQSDIFSLGLTFYYALTYGKHACGSPVRQIINLCEGKLIFDDLKDEKFAVHINLVKAMLQLDPLERPPIDVICQHPFFWNNDRCLRFITDVRNFMNGKTIEVQFFKSKVECNLDWHSKLDQPVRNFLKVLTKKYSGSSLLKLVDFISDKDEHCTEWPNELKDRSVFGDGPEGNTQYMQYFLDRFPSLITQLYVLAQEHRLRSKLAPYFNGDKKYF